MKRVSVKSVRYDGSLRDQFEADLLSADDGVYCVLIHPGTPVRTLGGVEREVTTTTQILFADRWFNVNHFHEVVAPYSNLWYANLAMPAEFNGHEIRWVDLDLDVMHDVDRGVVLKDEDIFAKKAAAGIYPQHIVRQVESARDEILRLAANAAFPFDREHQIALARS